MICLCRYTTAAHASNWCGRTPGSQTLAVLDEVQVDGGRKCLKNEAKCPTSDQLNRSEAQLHIDHV